MPGPSARGYLVAVFLGRGRKKIEDKCKDHFKDKAASAHNLSSWGAQLQRSEKQVSGVAELHDDCGGFCWNGNVSIHDNSEMKTIPPLSCRCIKAWE